ncbi:DUF885 domain-containing protein [Litorimonas sp.]|uniref:DUF885 domain-containing protein n=1 Tax=Litorimonas sp. TaxID=1892381 RepID=UPI003A8AF5A1
MREQSAALNDWFKARYEEKLARSPQTQTYLGMKTGKDKLDDISDMAIEEDAALHKAWLDEMRRTFDIDRLDPQTRLSYRLYEYEAEMELALYEFAQHDYVFQHMNGPHSDLPSFMINFHTITNEADARGYISRLNQFDRYLGQAADRAEAQFASGIELPKFVYAKLRTASENVISGYPFDEDAPSPLYADFKQKVEALDLSDDAKNNLYTQAELAMGASVKPAYDRLIGLFNAQEASASSESGAWKLPDGEAYYAARLKQYTTTDLTAEEIHEIGLAEVERLQTEMKTIVDQVGFDGSLLEFFDYLRTDEQFVYPDTEAGREAYIADAAAIINDMNTRLDGLFLTKPEADLIVKRVEPFREDTAFGAFYNSPAPDGSRPGTYYINLKDVGEQPKYLQQALAYHEGIPGHHMQIALAQELEGLPRFRTLGGHTAYIEGWGLYAESLPDGLGLYTDPYSKFGQLSMEIFRAARLVVDTGVHAKKWTREEAVQYYLDNIPNPEGDIRAEIDRYIVWPGQATAYMIGKLKIQDLRKKAEDVLGENFDIAEFHDVILINGSVPLDILEQNVDNWILTKKET